MTQYRVFLNGNRICPKCSSMLSKFHTDKDIVYQCMDCKSRFTIIDQSKVDKEFIFGQMEVKK